MPEKSAPIQPLPVAMLFGQPWHLIKDRLPAPLVAETEAWIVRWQRDQTPPNELMSRLYEAYLNAGIEIFP